MSDHRFEWRVGWAAFTNQSFRGTSDWMPWEGCEETVEEVEDAINASQGVMSEGLEAAMDWSGFETWVEVRVHGIGEDQ